MKTVNLNIRISEEMRDEFKQIAEDNAQTPSMLVRKWIENYIKENKEENKMKVVISKKKNHEGVIGKEFEEVYGEYEIDAALEHIKEITEEYESELNANGFELTDNDKVNDIYSVSELINGLYDFDCGDFTYYIEIKEGN